MTRPTNEGRTEWAGTPATSPVVPTAIGRATVESTPAAMSRPAEVEQPYQSVPRQPHPAAGQPTGQPWATGQPTPQQGGTVIGREQPPAAVPVAAQPAPALPADVAPAQPTTWSTTTVRAAAQAAAASTASPAATSLAEALAGAGQQGPPDNTDERRPPNEAGRRGPRGRLPRLRIGSHMASHAALAQLRTAPPGGGLILGADRQRRPVPARVFRPGPTRITLVGGTWAGQLIAFRALAVGARVAVLTAEPQSWRGFGERMTGHHDRVAIFTSEQLALPTSTAQHPLLLVRDLGPASVAATQPLGPWQTQLTVLRQLDRPGTSAIRGCDLVMLQRLDGGEADLAGIGLNLPGASTQFLQRMADDMIALVNNGSDRYIWLAQTTIERQYIGAPRR